MTHHRFVIRAGSSSIHDNEEELLKDRKLILPLECVKYCTRNESNRVRYTQLKKLSNDKLAELTVGQETDMGGSFENYIAEFESADEPHNRLVERQKISHKKSYIIPNIQNIRNYFAKRNLINLIDETPTHFKAIESRNCENEKMSSSLVIGEIPEDNNKAPIVREHKLYTVSYYYENGKPVFVEDRNGWEKDPAPFYEEGTYMSAFKVTEHLRIAKDMTVSPVLVTDPWSIYLIRPKNKNILVNEESLEKLLSIGKSIISSDPTMPLGIAIEYNGYNTISS
jgi:hypothetical protein